MNFIFKVKWHAVFLSYIFTKRGKKIIFKFLLNPRNYIQSCGKSKNISYIWNFFGFGGEGSSYIKTEPSSVFISCTPIHDHVNDRINTYTHEIRTPSHYTHLSIPIPPLYPQTPYSVTVPLLPLTPILTPHVYKPMRIRIPTLSSFKLIDISTL